MAQARNVSWNCDKCNKKHSLPYQTVNSIVTQIEDIAEEVNSEVPNVCMHTQSQMEFTENNGFVFTGNK